MYNLSDFIEFDVNKIRSGEHPVLVWSKKEGYYFVQFGFVLDENTKIVGMME